ncbi:MAG TPA: FAD:protein FMN transferase, partial [Azospirillaceae bacterium]|nr:FAD:protein FMN transferase [Azospirillaceae bacterium]
AGADANGPPETAVVAARRLVDHRAIRLEPDRIAFARRGMAATLNGIAQGYITDRVAERLRAEGMTQVLVDLGEIRALGRHPDGRAWQVGLEDPRQPGGTALTLQVENRAVATSGGYGTRFDGQGRFSHLFDPVTGRCVSYWLSVTVLAADATTADALSTALSVVPVERAAGIVQRHRAVTARLTAADGTVGILES